MSVATRGVSRMEFHFYHPSREWRGYSIYLFLAYARAIINEPIDGRHFCKQQKPLLPTFFIFECTHAVGNQAPLSFQMRELRRRCIHILRQCFLECVIIPIPRPRFNSESLLVRDFNILSQTASK